MRRWIGASGGDEGADGLLGLAHFKVGQECPRTLDEDEVLS